MAHFHTLGRLIRALGGDPGVTMRMRTPRVDLSGDASCRALPVVRRMLRQDLTAEAASITELESLAAAARDEAVISELREIIREEQEQYEALERLLREI
jgi:bacterioferritin (cytochrome b1)